LSDPTTQLWMNFGFGVFGVVGTILGLVGLVLYLKDRTIKRPRWNVETVPIITGNVTKILDLTAACLRGDRFVKLTG